MSVRSAALASALVCAVPLAARAQTVSPPAPFVGPVQQYAVQGCGNVAVGPTFPAPQTPLCVGGIAAIGLIAPQAGLSFYQLAITLSGIRPPGFVGEFRSADYSGVQFAYSFLRPGIATPATAGDYLFTSIDPTQLPAARAILFAASADQIVPGSLQLAPTATGFYAYRLPAFNQGNLGLTIALTVTPIPEPSTFAFGAAGLAIVGFIARRRSRHA